MTNHPFHKKNTTGKANVHTNHANPRKTSFWNSKSLSQKTTPKTQKNMGQHHPSQQARQNKNEHGSPKAPQAFIDHTLKGLRMNQGSRSSWETPQILNLLALRMCWVQWADRSMCGAHHMCQKKQQGSEGPTKERNLWAETQEEF